MVLTLFGQSVVLGVHVLNQHGVVFQFFPCADHDDGDETVAVSLTARVSDSCTGGRHPCDISDVEHSAVIQSGRSAIISRLEPRIELNGPG